MFLALKLTVITVQNINKKHKKSKDADKRWKKLSWNLHHWIEDKHLFVGSNNVFIFISLKYEPLLTLTITYFTSAGEHDSIFISISQSTATVPIIWTELCHKWDWSADGIDV